MSRIQTRHKQVFLMETKRSRLMIETPTPPPLHEPIPKRNPDRPPTTIPQPIVPHPGSDPQPTPNSAPEPGPAPITMLDPRLRLRGNVVTRFAIRRVRRLVPLKSSYFRLRYRNLSYQRKWHPVWS